jgi:hypothetical protein
MTLDEHEIQQLKEKVAKLQITIAVRDAALQKMRNRLIRIAQITREEDVPNHGKAQTAGM